MSFPVVFVPIYDFALVSNCRNKACYLYLANDY